MKVSGKTHSRKKRKARIRRKIRGTSERPRLSIFRSSKYIYAQIIDDMDGRTICACSTLEKEIKSKLKSTDNLEAATEIGKLIAERAKQKNVSSVVFDRNGFIYHGRVQALAESARAAGLKF